MTDPAQSVALVTGASRGIGRAIAIELAKDGHQVGVNYLANAKEADRTVGMVAEIGGTAIPIQSDVSVPAEVDRCFEEAEYKLGPVTVLVNNAGVRHDSLAMTTTDEAWDRVIATNLSGTFYCCRRALKPMLKARTGRIVNVSSVAGLRGNPGQVNYSAAKAGVIGLTHSLAREIASRSITVNAVAPGLITTDLTADLGPDRLEAITNSIPAKRLGTPQDVASLVAWLCSDAASYVTGSVFTTDGGMSA
jgi:3-oxoacyl-[acyl-carrier protein] reductase